MVSLSNTTSQPAHSTCAASIPSCSRLGRQLARTRLHALPVLGPQTPIRRTRSASHRPQRHNQVVLWAGGAMPRHAVPCSSSQTAAHALSSPHTLRAAPSAMHPRNRDGRRCSLHPMHNHVPCPSSVRQSHTSCREATATGPLMHANCRYSGFPPPPPPARPYCRRTLRPPPALPCFLPPGASSLSSSCYCCAAAAAVGAVATSHGCPRTSACACSP